MDNNDAENLQRSLAAKAKKPLDKGLMARLGTAATILVLFILFAAQNTESVTIDFLSWSFQLNQFLMMLFSAAAGVFIWEFAGVYSRRAKKKRS